ncbi:MAG TPA: type II toxin-antitoxin system antitoxin SocA domain-containing protein [Galbitalea sp.]|jgi:uncharacterized phage-associated protein
MTTTASEVARYFLALQDDEDAISNLKLQKLLYYAQGFSLALTGNALFPEQIKAWVHGPVVPSVWQDYRECAGDAIPRPSDFDPATLDAQDRGVIEEVYAVYGQFSAWRLREMTHRERPWKDTPPSAVIPRAEMEQFFKTLTK